MVDKFIHLLGLSGTSPQQLKRRVFFWSGVTWIPLLILSSIEALVGTATPKVSFLADFCLHFRLLLALPLLLILETSAHHCVSSSLPTLSERGMIRKESAQALEKIASWIQTIESSIRSDVVLIFLTVCFLLSSTTIQLPPEITSWRNLGTGASTIANGWYHCISLGVYNYFVLRWLWKFLLWSGFLTRLATLKPILQSHHPDQMGGLSFLIPRHLKPALASMAVSIVMSANIAEMVHFGSQKLSSWQMPVAAYLIVINIIFLAPLSAYTPLLIITKQSGLIRYGTLAMVFSQQFEEKWTLTRLTQPSDLLGSADIQSLNDLGGSFANMREMRIFLMNSRFFLGLNFLIALPFLPLILFEIPLLQILKVVAKSLA